MKIRLYPTETHPRYGGRAYLWTPVCDCGWRGESQRYDPNAWNEAAHHIAATHNWMNVTIEKQ
ncbi:hypothetical protein [Actinopolyspora halophila]|uniref:hypothetical protein n=1 Tax=Actinopolyspora halophila TaxID=1850 RepID=UPI00037BC633|nr:hypothetical protein [Actinopolyspora halophila]